MSDENQMEAVKYLHEMLEKVISVNSFFITASYGTFFGVWVVVKDNIDPLIATHAALWILASSLIFAAWHITGLTMLNITVLDAVGKAGGVPRFKDLRQKVKAKMAEFVQRSALVWMAITAITAIVGNLILVSGMVRYLLS